MKLPDKDDPFGDKEGSLPRQLVLDALYKGAVDISHRKDGQVALIKNNIAQVVSLTDPVGGLMVRSLIRMFELNIADLYGNRPANPSFQR
jgi:hypothetical protein